MIHLSFRGVSIKLVRVRIHTKGSSARESAAFLCVFYAAI
nr:MAG TPA: hypothetical protein [Caudoviricetes sp.]